MKHFLLKVYIELRAKTLNRPFDYLYCGEELVQPGMRVVVDFHNQKLVAYIVEAKIIPNIDELESLNSKYKIKPIERIIDTKPIISDELFKVLSRLSASSQTPLIHFIQMVLPPSLKPTTSSFKAPKISYLAIVKLKHNDLDVNSLTKKQHEIYLKLLSNEIILKSSITPTTLKSMIAKDVVKIEYLEKDRFSIELSKIAGNDEVTPILSNEQQAAVTKILQSDKKTFLLEGVTGSGKTEVYFSLISEMIARGLTSILLVSEISLTPKIISLANERFGNRIAVIHSGLSSGQKYDQYRKISNGEVSLIIGARSAVFSPARNLGLIIVDEEHSPTYHQNSVPFYQLHDVINLLQEYSPSLSVVYGSATPSLVTASRARKGAIGHALLPNRINKQDLPEVEIVDMSNYNNYFENNYFISKQLHKALSQNLNRHEQSIILVNRRGFSAYIECERCHSIAKCEKCGHSLRYHKSDNTLKCHSCGASVDFNPLCKECGCRRFVHLGFGTETVEAEIQRLFPNAVVARIDSDNTGKDTNNLKILSNFNLGKIDILVGTQMISKGHDFPNVTLSAVVSGDLSLNLPNFLAAESVFNLICQTIGRSGRGIKKGRAIIQTFSKDNYAIMSASTQDYQAFYEKEMLVRKISKFPPYWYLCLLHIYAKNTVDLEELTQEVTRTLKVRFGVNANVIVTGPYSPYSTIVGPYKKQNILIRYKNEKDVLSVVSDVVSSLNPSADCKIDAEFNPLDLY